MQHSIIDLLFLGEVILMIFFISMEPCVFSGCPFLIPGWVRDGTESIPCVLSTHSLFSRRIFY